MSGASVSLKIATPVVEVGGNVEARVERPAADPGKTRALIVALECHHDCRKSDNSKRVVVHADAQLDLVGGGAVDEVVQLRVPDDASVSFTGALIRNLWRVSVTEDVAMGRDKRVQQIDLVVAPRGGGSLYTQPHPIR